MSDGGGTLRPRLEPRGSSGGLVWPEREVTGWERVGLSAEWAGVLGPELADITSGLSSVRGGG